MAWYVNHYHCTVCRLIWSEEWSCTCNDECPNCRTETEPDERDDLTVLVQAQCANWLVAVSPPAAEGTPNYIEHSFASAAEAQSFAERAKVYLEEWGTTLRDFYVTHYERNAEGGIQTL